MGEQADPYEQIARFYDAENAELVEDLPAYALLADRFGGPVLEVGCGTGRVALHLAQQGIRVVGIDVSAAMLRRARQHADERGLSGPLLTWRKADMRTLALDEQFGLCTLAYNTFAHLLTQDDQIAALERIAAHIRPGGGLALDLRNLIVDVLANGSPGLDFERVFTDPATGHAIMQRSLASLDWASQIVDVTWVYDEITPDSIVKRTLIPARYRYTFGPELRLLLRLAGFSPVELYGDYDFSPYEANSPRLFAVAVRDRTTQSGRGSQWEPCASDRRS